MVCFLFIISWVAFISTTYTLGISILETLGYNFDSLIVQLILIALVLVTIVVARIGYERLLWMYRKLPGEVVDITPDLAFKRKDLSFDYWQSVPRGNEIDKWLKEHTEVTNYVILDDDSDMLVKQI